MRRPSENPERGMLPASARWREFTPKLLTVLAEGYGADRLRRDCIAGLTVAIVALPLAMALAIASGASPDKGLVTAVVAGFLISALGGSRMQIGGPTGAFVVVVFGVIAQHGYDGLLLATAMAGVLLVIAGYARLGNLVRFIPLPVVTGFTSGIAVIIATSQVMDFLGLSIADVPADFIARWRAYLAALDTVQLATVAIGGGSLALIIGLRKWAPRMPDFLLVIVIASVLVAGFGLPVETVGSRFPDFATGLPTPALPDFSFAKLQAVTPAAFTIAFLAGIEALLSAVVADGMVGSRHRPNQELVGQGVANFASALFGGLPATGAIARTATNIRAGAATPVAGILHAAFVGLFVLFGSGLMAYIPLAALAAILFMVAWGMSEQRRFRQILHMPASDRTLLLLTFGLTVLVDLTVAIGVGVTLAALLFMRQMSNTVTIEAGSEAVTLDAEEARALGERRTLPKGVEMFSIQGPLFFGVANDLLDVLQRIGSAPKVVILRMRSVPLLDASGLSAIEGFVRQASAARTRVIISGAQPQPRAMLELAVLGDAETAVRYCQDFASALAAATGMIASQPDSTGMDSDPG